MALVGPTASGKSAAAVAAAEVAGAVVVAVDAFTVYRQMTIGTAKPPASLRRRVPHRMIDVLDVAEECTVQWFQARARHEIDLARSAGRPVLLVGGSGLYFRAVVDPLEFPPTDPGVRARHRRGVAADPPAAHRRLAAADPEGAARIDTHNVRRITRALEVIELTGRPFSSFRTGWDAYQPVYPGLSVVGTSLAPAELQSRITDRVRAMLDRGWIEEARSLVDRRLSASAAQAIGYAELFTFLRQGRHEGAAPDALADVAEAIAVRTRRFAARQRRWFAGDPRVEWVPPDAAGGLLVRALTAGSHTHQRGRTGS